MPDLKDLTVDWVSLVDRAAVRDPIHQSEPQRFLVWKRDDHTPGGSMTPEEKAALDKAQADLKKAQDDLTATKATLEKAQSDNTAMEARLKALEDANGVKKEEEIDKSDLPPAVRAAFEKSEADRAALAERVEKAEKGAAESDRLVKAERDERLTAEFIAKAETLKALPVKPAEFGPVLKAASEKLTKDEYQALEKALTAADEQIQKGDLFKEQGRAHEGERADSAYAEATQKAEELRKSDSKLTKTAALDQAFRDNPDLQARYLAEIRR